MVHISTANIYSPKTMTYTETSLPTYTTPADYRTLRSISIEDFFKNGSVKQVDNYLTKTASKASLLSEEVRVIVGKHSSAVLHSSNYIHDMLENSEVILSTAQTAKDYLSDIYRILDKHRHSQLHNEVTTKSTDDKQRELWMNLLMSIDKLDIFAALQHISMVLLEMKFIKTIPLHSSYIPIQFLKFFIIQKCIHLPSEITSLMYNTRKPLQCIQLIYQKLPILFGLMNTLFNVEAPLETLLREMQTRIDLFNSDINKRGIAKTPKEYYEILISKKEPTSALDLHSLFEESLSQICGCPNQIHSFCMHNIGDNNLSSAHLVDFLSVLLILNASNTQSFDLGDFFVLRGATLSTIFNSFVNFMEAWSVDSPNVRDTSTSITSLGQEPLIKHLTQFIYTFEATLFCTLFLFSSNSSVSFIETYFGSFLSSADKTLATWEVHIDGKQSQGRPYTPKLKLKQVNDVKDYLERIQQGQDWQLLSQIIYEFINTWTKNFFGQFKKFLTHNYTKFSCRSLVLFWIELKKRMTQIREENSAINLFGQANSADSLNATQWKYMCRRICGTELDDPLDLLEGAIYTACADIINYTSQGFQLSQSTQDATDIPWFIGLISNETSLFDKQNSGRLQSKSGTHITNMINDWQKRMDTYFKLIHSEFEFLHHPDNSISLEFTHTQLTILLESFITTLKQNGSPKFSSHNVNNEQIYYTEQPLIWPQISQSFINSLKIERLLNDFESLNISGTSVYILDEKLNFFQRFCKFGLSHTKEEISNKMCEVIYAMEDYVLFAFSKFILLYNTPLLSRIARELDNKILVETNLTPQITGVIFPEQATSMLYRLLLNCSQLFSRLHTDLMLTSIPLRLIYATKQSISRELYYIYKEKLNQLRGVKSPNLLLFQLLFDISLASMLMNSSHYLIQRKLSDIFYKYDCTVDTHLRNNPLEQLEKDILENFLTDPADKLLAQEMIRNNVSQVMIFSSTLFSFLIKENPQYGYWLQYEPSENLFTNLNKPSYPTDSPLLPIPPQLSLISEKFSKKNEQQPPSLKMEKLPDRKIEFPTKKPFTTPSPTLKSSPNTNYFRGLADSPGININSVYDISKQMENVGAYIGKRVGSMQSRMTEAVKKKSDHPNL